ncbi:MAG TPA: single-stranded DNA-binding protein, partial [Achromobacter sp.]|nr:single-stranded DNA-binding protein [Achromobacter sp.]
PAQRPAPQQRPAPAAAPASSGANLADMDDDIPF